jgi:hypothetical protein
MMEYVKMIKEKEDDNVDSENIFDSNKFEKLDEMI